VLRAHVAAVHAHALVIADLAAKPTMDLPLLRALAQQGLVIVRTAAELGFSPTSRPKLVAAGNLAAAAMPRAPSRPATPRDKMTLEQYISQQPPN
jgi:phage terminase small subunit